MSKQSFKLLAMALLALLMPVQALSGWGDEPRSEQPKPAVAEAVSEPSEPVNKPEWEKWAFSLPSAEGERLVTFNSLARSGSPFVLVWWQSDCPVCHLQLPFVQQLARMAESEEVDVQVVSVNIDTDDQDCARYIKEKGLTFSVLRDPRARRTDKTYRVRDEGTPVTYVFKAGGIPAGSFSGFKKGFPAHVLSLLDQQLPVTKTAARGDVARDVDDWRNSRGNDG